MLIQGGKDGTKEVWAEKILLPFRCSVSAKGNGDELALVRYIDCAAPLDEVD